MLSKRDWDAAAALERKMYLELTEVQDLTAELSSALDRRDQVSAQMFLGMRQEQINRLQEWKELLRKQCAALPREDGERLRQVLSGQRKEEGDGRVLSALVNKNRALLDRVIQADRRLNRRLAGGRSFYGAAEHEAR